MTAADLLLDPGARPVIAHRGASGLKPENTIAAFVLARELGADGIELDVRLSADGVVMVHHDPTLERTTDRTGRLDRLKAAELGAVDAGQGEGIPTLAAALDAAGDLPVLIELKEARAALPALEVVRHLGAERQVAFASFHPRALAPLGGQGIPLGASRPEIAWAALGATTGWPPGRAGFDFYAVPHKWKDFLTVPTSRFIARAARQGRLVHVWTVDVPLVARTLWGRGVRGILTNRPEVLLPERNALPPGLARLP
ncbi:MAG TPA: glycerophosphodiester phosphodiesterase family protein [Gemmatimonadales bacterium]|nr:glycerophosphodiester phosphodiesterase family protein [Gemmatimonadales bacterium]